MSRRMVACLLLFPLAGGLVACNKSSAGDGVSDPARDMSGGVATSVGTATRGFAGALLKAGENAEGGVPFGPDYKVQIRGDSAVLIMDPAPGDSINALQPPVLEFDNGDRFVFSGTSVSADSAYFTSDVTLTVPTGMFPIRAALHTSYCPAGERVCRMSTRPVVIEWDERGKR